jgi:hypothetical protein
MPAAPRLGDRYANELFSQIWRGAGRMARFSCPAGSSYVTYGRAWLLAIGLRLGCADRLVGFVEFRWVELCGKAHRRIVRRDDAGHFGVFGVQMT